MKFKEIKEEIQSIEARYRTKGFYVESKYFDQAYRLKLSDKQKQAVIRDGVYDNKINEQDVKITSFDVLFEVDGSTYLLFVSDYTLDDYLPRLREVELLIDEFFAGNYTFSEDRWLFWKKKYLDIKIHDNVYHFLKTNQAKA